jgi:hypothetical protein
MSCGNIESVRRAQPDVSRRPRVYAYFEGSSGICGAPESRAKWNPLHEIWWPALPLADRSQHITHPATLFVFSSSVKKTSKDQPVLGLHSVCLILLSKTDCTATHSTTPVKNIHNSLHMLRWLDVRKRNRTNGALTSQIFLVLLSPCLAATKTLQEPKFAEISK